MPDVGSPGVPGSVGDLRQAKRAQKGCGLNASAEFCTVEFRVVQLLMDRTRVGRDIVNMPIPIP